MDSVRFASEKAEANQRFAEFEGAIARLREQHKDEIKYTPSTQAFPDDV